MDTKIGSLLPLIASINLYSLSFYHFYQFYLDPIRLHSLGIGILFLSSMISSANIYRINAKYNMLRFYFALLSSSTIILAFAVWLIFLPRSETLAFIPLVSIPLIYILTEGVTCIGSDRYSLH